MRVEIRQGELADKPKFQHLMQLYLYDFSEFLQLDLDGAGHFKESILDNYFTDPSKTPFVVLVDDALAGFVLVSAQTLLPANAGGRCIKEFFIMRRYRRQGIGKRVAAEIFSLSPCRWEVRVVQANQAAERFWEAAIQDYAGSDYQKEVRDDELWHGSMFSLGQARRAANPVNKPKPMFGPGFAE